MDWWTSGLVIRGEALLEAWKGAPEEARGQPRSVGRHSRSAELCFASSARLPQPASAFIGHVRVAKLIMSPGVARLAVLFAKSAFKFFTFEIRKVRAFRA